MPGAASSDGGLSSTDKLRLVIGGLVGVALFLTVLTVLYVRHTKPLGAAAATDDERDDADGTSRAGDGAGPATVPESPRTVSPVQPAPAPLTAGAAAVGATSAVTVLGAKGPDEKGSGNEDAGEKASGDEGSGNEDAGDKNASDEDAADPPEPATAGVDDAAAVVAPPLPTRIDLGVPDAVVTREDLELLARPSSPLTKADLFAGAPSDTGELPVPRAFDASSLFVEDAAAPPSPSA